MPPIYRERMNEKKNYTYHLIAIFTVGVWGLTFISTKVLIANGLSPKEIFLLRFLIAYIGIWFISPRKLFANNWKDELWLLLGGITGGSVYFLTENMALGITLATNVAFIVCTAPLLTTIFSLMIYKKEKATRTLIGGSLMALIGVAMVVYNGSFVFYSLLDLCAGRVACRQTLQLLRESVNIFLKLFICHLNADAYSLYDLIFIGSAVNRIFFQSGMQVAKNKVC